MYSPAKDDPKIEDKLFREFEGVNTQASRIAISDNQFAWLENVMPVGGANARVVPASTAVQTLTGESVVSAIGVNINNVDYNICFTVSGAGYQVLAASPYTSVKFANAGTFSASGVTAAQWKNERVLILDTAKGYFDWNTVALTTISVPTIGTSIATFAGRVWVANGRTLQFSDVNSYNSFAGAGGSLIITDSILRSNIKQLLNANNFLYIYGANCVYVIGDVRVSGGITLYTLTNLTASVGTDMPMSVIPYGRDILFQTRYGMYGQKGAIPVKISDHIDGTIDRIDYTQPVSAGQAIIFKQLCAVFSFTYLDPVAGTRPLLAVYFREKWFFASQGALTIIWGTIVNGQPALFGTDAGGIIYRLFNDATVNIATKVSTKLWDMGDPIANKQVMKLGLSFFVPAIQQSLSASLDTESDSTALNIPASSTITWVNNLGQLIVFVNGSSQALGWISSGYIFYQSDSGGYSGGKYVGVTITANTPAYTLYAIIFEFIKRSRWGL